MQAKKKKARNSGEQGSPAKHQRVTPNDVLLRRYPTRVLDAPVDDACSTERHKKAIEEESKKSKPRDSVLLPLMKSTFQARRMFIQAKVEGTLQSFPTLSRPAVVSYYIQFVRFSLFIMVKGHTTGVVLLIITMVNDMKYKSDHDVKLSFLLFTWSRRWDW